MAITICRSNCKSLPQFMSQLPSGKPLTKVQPQTPTCRCPAETYFLPSLPFDSFPTLIQSLFHGILSQHIFLGKFIPANIRPLNVNSCPFWKDVWKPWKQRPEQELWHGHIQRKVTSFFSISIKVRVTVYGSRRHFRQRWDLLKFTNISMCPFISTNSSSLQPYNTLEICCICRQFFTG